MLSIDIVDNLYGKSINSVIFLLNVHIFFYAYIKLQCKLGLTVYKYIKGSKGYERNKTNSTRDDKCT